MQTIDQATSALIPYQFNNRTHSETQINRIANSINEFGFNQPIVVDEKNVVIVGHGRLLAAQKLGIKTVPTLVIKDMPELKKKAYRILDNKLQNDSSWELDNLRLELGSLEDEGWKLEDWGLDELKDLFPPEEPEISDDEFEASESVEPFIQRGDLIELGDHRLLCGDCTKEEDVRFLMDGKLAALFATDPPYLVDYDGMNHPSKIDIKLNNKDWSDTYGQTWDDGDKNSELFDQFISVAVPFLQNNAAWYCWHASRMQSKLEAAWVKAGAFVHQQIIWVKNLPVLTYSHYMWQHEPCFYGWLKGKKPRCIAKDHPSTVWNIDTISSKERPDHPTPKPIEVFAIPMKQHTEPKDICYEPFCGSGSQLIAAEQLGRICYAMEIEPKYCEVVIERFAKHCQKNNKEFSCKINGKDFSLSDLSAALGE